MGDSPFPINPDLRGTPFVEAVNAGFNAIRTGSFGIDAPDLLPGELYANPDTGYEEQATQDDPANRTQLWPLDGAPHSVIPKLITLADCTAGIYDVNPREETFLLVNATDGDIVIRLPLTADSPRKRIAVLRVDEDSASVTVKGRNDGELIIYEGVGGVPLQRFLAYAAFINYSDLYANSWVMEATKLSNWRRITASGDVGAETILLIDSTAGAVVARLPRMSSAFQDELIIKHIAGANAVTINPRSDEQLDDGAAGVGITISGVGDRMRLVLAYGQWRRVD